MQRLQRCFSMCSRLVSALDVMEHSVLVCVFSFVCPALGMSENKQRRVVLRCRDPGERCSSASGCILA